MGNLTRDPELRYTPGGQAVCDIGIAINRKYTANGQDKEEVCFVDIVVWAKQAESCSKYLRKGSSVLVEGRLQYDTWEDKDGKKRSRLRVTAERVQFLSSKSDDSKQLTSSDDSHQNNYNNGQQQPAYQQPAYQQPAYQQPAYQNGPAQQNIDPRHQGPNPNQSFQQNQQNQQNQPVNRSEPMPPPPPNVFDNDEPEDDIPF